MAGFRANDLDKTGPALLKLTDQVRERLQMLWTYRIIYQLVKAKLSQLYRDDEYLRSQLRGLIEQRKSLNQDAFTRHDQEAIDSLRNKLLQSQTFFDAWHAKHGYQWHWDSGELEEPNPTLPLELRISRLEDANRDLQELTCQVMMGKPKL